MGRTSAEESTGRHSSKSIRNAIRRFEAYLASLDAVATTMELHQIEEMEVKYQAALKRALKDMNRWSGAAEKALDDEMDRKGLFQAVNGTQDVPARADEPAAEDVVPVVPNAKPVPPSRKDLRQKPTKPDSLPDQPKS
jgi:hypothetical protein